LEDCSALCKYLPKHIANVGVISIKDGINLSSTERSPAYTAYY
jgi:hypothetical protein